MNKEQAKEFIKDTFESPFNKEKFVAFIKNLLNNIEDSSFIYRGNLIPDAFKQYISTLERIGKYTDGENEIDLLIVKLKRETSLERARAMQRNFIAWYLKGSRGGKLKDAALVAFVHPDKEDWRFSLIKMEYRFEEISSGKIRAEEKFTPARRWSFLVGKNEHSHTSQSRLYPLLKNDVNNPTLEQLEEAFNIETVTREFFENYRNLFIRTVDELDKIVESNESMKSDFKTKNINTVDFAKKLLAQIVFLYFLQKKGWFGVERDSDWGTGPKDFLRRLFNKEYGDYENFFNDILEPLFYEALARERDDNFYSRFNCKIPFLNGGLFESIGGYDWIHTDINLPDELFSNNRITPEGDMGDGILDILDRFNFTVREDEPFEKEVAIDPELLGKLYEKFNAIRQDNFGDYKEALSSGKKHLEKQFNKKFGVYYTPREIVHYMCQQSLVYCLHTSVNQEFKQQPLTPASQLKLDESATDEQLRMNTTDKEIISIKDIEEFIKYGEQFIEGETVVKEKGKETKTYPHKIPEPIRKNANIIDEKLREIKVCDPAVGSGAFLVGMMSETVKARNLLSVFIDERERSVYNFKRESIENSLYGVDIDSGACEITKLRLWLSLVVDEENFKQIKPLPNLDYKIMQGNSLISEFLDINFDIEEEQKDILKFKDEVDTLIEKFNEKKNEFLNESNKKRKDNLRQEIDDLIIKIFEEKLKREKANYFSQLKSIEEKYLQLPNKEERDKLIKDEKEKLYKNTGFNLEEAEKQLKEYTIGRKTRPFFPWRLYFAEVFHNNGGFDVVIANPPYVKEYTNRKAFDGLRESPYYQGKIDIWYLFACNGIDLLKDNYGVLTFIAQNNWVTSYGASKLRNKVIKDTTILKMLDFGDYKIFENAGIQTMIMMFKKDTETDNYKFDYRRLTVSNECFHDVLDLLNKKSNPKIEYLTPVIIRNKYLSVILTFSVPSIEKILDKMREQSNFNLYESEIAQGIVAAPDRYFIIYNLSNFTEKEKFFIKPFYTNTTRWSGNRFQCYIFYICDKNFKGKNINEYPNIKNYFEHYKQLLEEAKKKYGTPNKPYFYLHRERDERFFKKGSKIVGQTRTDIPGFLYTENEYYGSRAMNFIKTDRINLKYLLALLNSSLFFIWFKFRGKILGNLLHIDKEPLLALPIIKPTERKQKKVIDIVNKIIPLTQSEDYLENPGKQTKVKEYEHQIDQMVYKLYGLTDEEIKIVESGK